MWRYLSKIAGDCVVVKISIGIVRFSDGLWSMQPAGLSLVYDDDDDDNIVFVVSSRKRWV